jgi:hypothetical protein
VSAHTARRANAFGYDQRTETVCSHGSLAKVANPVNLQSTRMCREKV